MSIETVPGFPARTSRGYNPNEVELWAMRVSSEFERAKADLAAREFQLDEARAELDRRRGEELEIARTLRTAQMLGERIVADTNDQAAQRKREAEAEAAVILANARAAAQQVLAEATRGAEAEREALEVERHHLQAEVAELRRILHDERLRARERLSDALRSVDERLLGGSVVDAPSGELLPGRVTHQV